VGIGRRCGASGPRTKATLGQLRRVKDRSELTLQRDPLRGTVAPCSERCAPFQEAPTCGPAGYPPPPGGGGANGAPAGR
jgi:hypothetical protein